MTNKQYCHACGQLFESKNPQKFCSTVCASEFRVERKKQEDTEKIESKRTSLSLADKTIEGLTVELAQARGQITILKRNLDNLKNDREILEDNKEIEISEAEEKIKKEYEPQMTKMAKLEQLAYLLNEENNGLKKQLAEARKELEDRPTKEIEKKEIVYVPRIEYRSGYIDLKDDFNTHKRHLGLIALIALAATGVWFFMPQEVSIFRELFKLVKLL
jgi:hypothetical protein